VLRRRGSVLRLDAEGRDLRPRTSGLVQARYPGTLRGWVTVSAQISAQAGSPAARRSFRVKL
jgi:hypothetical protein